MRSGSTLTGSNPASATARSISSGITRVRAVWSVWPSSRMNQDVCLVSEASAKPFPLRRLELRIAGRAVALDFSTRLERSCGAHRCYQHRYAPNRRASYTGSGRLGACDVSMARIFFPHQLPSEARKPATVSRGGPYCLKRKMLLAGGWFWKPLDASPRPS